MRNESRPADYSKAKSSVLQELAHRGLAAAIKELARRGVARTDPSDVTKMSYLQLRALVQRWREGATITEKADSLDRARRAQDELAARFRVVEQYRRSGRERELDEKTFGPADMQALPAAPWLAPRPPRCISWQRPQGSKLYPSVQDEARAEINARAHAYYKAAGAPQKEK